MDARGLIEHGMRVKYNQNHAPTALWRFNTNSTPDVGAFTTTPTGSPTFSAGKYSNCLVLNGSSYLSVTDDALLKPTGDFTICAWIKNSTTAVYQNIFSSYYENPNAAGIVFGIHPTLNSLRIVTGKNTGIVANIDTSTLIGTIPVTDNVWHHVAVTVKNNYAQLYVDGVLDAGAYLMTPAYHASNLVRIGVLQNGVSTVHNFTGSIDDLMFINGYALDEAKIREIYFSSVEMPATIPVTKMAIVHDVGTYNGSTTPLTLFHGTDFLLSNSSILEPYVSRAKKPQGFISKAEKWAQLFENRNDTMIVQANPAAANANYNFLIMQVGVGPWTVRYNGYMNIVITHAAVRTYQTMGTSISTTSTGVGEWCRMLYRLPSPIVTAGEFGGMFSVSGTITLREKSPFYINIIQNNNGAAAGTNMLVGGSGYATRVYAYSQYL
jgi:hypothetical protein